MSTSFLVISRRSVSLTLHRSKRNKIKRFAQRQGESELMTDRSRNKAAMQHGSSAGQAMNLAYHDQNVVLAMNAQTNRTSYGHYDRRDSLGNFIYSSTHRNDPYTSNAKGIHYEYLHPTTDETRKTRNESITTELQNFTKAFSKYIYDAPISKTGMMENMRKRFKLTTKDDGSITPTFGLNDYTNKIARPNFWTQFLKGYKVEGMHQSPQCWKIYEAANEMLHPENWSIANEKESLERLKRLSTGKFYNHVIDEVKNKTIEWKLDAYDDDLPRIMDLMRMAHPTGSNVYFLTLQMKSKQSLNIWDRMGRPIVSDIESRDMNEIVTFAHYLPDPEWRGWLLHSKQNFHNVIQLPNSNLTSSISRQKDEVDDADEYTKEEVHSNYDIWSGTRDYTANRQRDYYHKGWNYGGTVESESIGGEGGLEHQMKKLDYQEATHSSLGKMRLTGKGMPIRLDGKFWDLHYQRKRAHIQHKRHTGKLPKKTDPKVWIPGQRRPT